MHKLLDAHCEWMVSERYSARTIRDRRKVLHHAHNHLPRGLDDVWAHEIQSYLYRPGLSVWTIHTYYSHLAGFYRWAERYEWLSYDPTAELPIPPSGAFLPKPLAPDEIRAILDHSTEPWLTASILALGAGLRASEIADLDRADVSESYVHVRAGKGNKPRLIETTDTVWRHVRGRPPGPLVVRPYGRGSVTGAWLSSRQRAHWLSLGMPHVHLHRLRHTFCTAMLDAGHDSMILRDLMGHASVLTTQGYALVSSARRRAAVSAVDAFVSGARAGL